MNKKSKPKIFVIVISCSLVDICYCSSNMSIEIIFSDKSIFDNKEE